MSVGTLNSQQLRSLVEDKWQRDLDAVAVGLHVAQPWKLPKVVEFDFGKAEVVRADTVFQVREALLDAERSKGRIILLTKLRQGDLGNDVVARLARSRLFAIDHWASLCSLFKAKELDPAICDASLRACFRMKAAIISSEGSCSRLTTRLATASASGSRRRGTFEMAMIPPVNSKDFRSCLSLVV